MTIIMETVLVNLTFENSVEFSESSPEDRNYAKLFWKSINSPAIVESKLNAQDANQQLKSAGVSERKEALAYPSAKEMQSSKLYIERVQQFEEADHKRKLQLRKHKIEEIRKASRTKATLDMKKSSNQDDYYMKKTNSAFVAPKNMELLDAAKSRTSSSAVTHLDKTPTGAKKPALSQFLTPEDQLECELGFNDSEDVRNLP